MFPGSDPEVSDGVAVDLLVCPIPWIYFDALETDLSFRLLPAPPTHRGIGNVQIVRPGDPAPGSGPRLRATAAARSVHTELGFTGADDAAQKREMSAVLDNLWIEAAGTGEHEVAAAPLTESHFRMLKSGPRPC